MTTARDLRIVGQHWTREIVFDSKGRLYLSIGARGDVLDDDPSPDATVQQVGADGTMTTFAAGLRNVVGMAVYPPASITSWPHFRSRADGARADPMRRTRVAARSVIVRGPSPRSRTRCPVRGNARVLPSPISPSSNDRLRRVSPIAVRPGKGLLTEPIAGA